MTGFEIYMKNPYWKDCYKNAPSDKLKRYLRLKFDNSPFVTSKVQEGYERELNALSNEFTAEEWKYLSEHTQSGMAKEYYLKRANK